MFRNNDFSRQIKEVKERISMERVVRLYEVELKRNRARCPFPEHNDSNPSFSVNKSTGKFKCFGCNKSGDVIDFVGFMEGCSNKEAVKKLQALTGLHSDEFIPAKPVYKVTQEENKSEQPSEKTLQIFQTYYDTLQLTASGSNYLHKRGLSDKTIDTFSIKSQDNHQAIAAEMCKSFSSAELKEAGLFNDYNYFVFSKQAIIIPYFRQGVPVYFSMRNITGKKTPYKIKRKEVLYVGNIENADKIVLFEGIFDALSFCQINGATNFIAVNGQFSYNKVQDMAAYFNTEIILAYDNDIPGALNRWQLEERGLQASVFEFYEKTDNIYEKIRNDFASHQVACQFFSSPDNKTKTRYKPKIKDLNDYLMSI